MDELGDHFTLALNTSVPGANAESIRFRGNPMLTADIIDMDPKQLAKKSLLKTQLFRGSCQMINAKGFIDVWTHDCGGRVTGLVDYENFCIWLEVQHPLNHYFPELQISRVVTPDIREFIREHAHRHDIAIQFYDSDITPGQTYRWWNSSIRDRYQLHEYQLESAQSNADILGG
ncbi:hypothetical protein DFQ29_007084 [Apophysomyces sp. BC1021]|nr:hypothetical protein DFQ29_007084 [Apophysomyces sp. BC1021]